MDDPIETAPSPHALRGTEQYRSGYCTENEIDRWTAHWKSFDAVANPRFHRASEHLCLLPGGLDGVADAYLYRDELVALVAQGTLPPGILCYHRGQLHRVALVNRTYKLVKLEVTNL
jgi:hypothetical protein